jgi:hypothetical protein
MQGACYVFRDVGRGVEHSSWRTSSSLASPLRFQAVGFEKWQGAVLADQGVLVADGMPKASRQSLVPDSWSFANSIYYFHMLRTAMIALPQKLGGGGLNGFDQGGVFHAATDRVSLRRSSNSDFSKSPSGSPMELKGGSRRASIEPHDALVAPCDDTPLGSRNQLGKLCLRFVDGELHGESNLPKMTRFGNGFVRSTLDCVQPAAALGSAACCGHSCGGNSTQQAAAGKAAAGCTQSKGTRAFGDSLAATLIETPLQFEFTPPSAPVATSGSSWLSPG